MELQFTPFIYPPTPFCSKTRQHMIFEKFLFSDKLFYAQKFFDPPPASYIYFTKIAQTSVEQSSRPLGTMYAMGRYYLGVAVRGRGRLQGFNVKYYRVCFGTPRPVEKHRGPEPCFYNFLLSNQCIGGSVKIF
jgi:hypothetical protein